MARVITVSMFLNPFPLLILSAFSPLFLNFRLISFPCHFPFTAFPAGSLLSVNPATELERPWHVHGDPRIPPDQISEGGGSGSPEYASQ